MAVKSMLEWENRTIKSSSAATSKESRESGSSPKHDMKSVAGSKNIKTQEYYNPVVLLPQSVFLFQSSGSDLSFGRQTTPLNISEIAVVLPNQEVANWVNDKRLTV